MQYLIPSTLWYNKEVVSLTDYFTGRFIDRTGKTNHGFETEILRPLLQSMPKDPGDFPTCMDIVAKDLKKKQGDLDIPVALLWSGGWDSTAVACAMIKNEVPFKVIYAESSIMENETFFKDVIEPSIPHELHPHPLYWLHHHGPDHIVVTGECGAQMMGTISFRKILVHMNTDFHDIGGGVDEEFTPFMSNPEPLYRWPDNLKDLVYHALDYYPGTFKSNYDAMWWITSVFKWQTIQFRMEMFSGKIQPHMYHWFMNDTFEAWTYNNDSSVKCPDFKWENYKLPLKDYIYNYTNNDCVYTLNKYASMQLPQPEIRYGVYQNRYVYRDEGGEIRVGC